MTRRLAAALTLALVIAVAHDAPAGVTQPNGPWSDFAEGVMSGCNANDISSAVNCGGTEGVGSRGYNFLTMTFYYVRGAGNGWTCKLETCEEGDAAGVDCQDATDWATMAVQQPSANTVRLTPATITRGGASDPLSASDEISWSIGVNFNRFRLTGCQASGTPNASDTLKVRYRLNWLHAL